MRHANHHTYSLAPADDSRTDWRGLAVEVAAIGGQALGLVAWIATTCAAVIVGGAAAGILPG